MRRASAYLRALRRIRGEAQVRLPEGSEGRVAVKLHVGVESGMAENRARQGTSSWKDDTWVLIGKPW